MMPADLRNRIEATFGVVHATDRFACALGVERRTVYRWLSGERKIPRYVSRVLDLVKACPPEQLPGEWKI